MKMSLSEFLSKSSMSRKLNLSEEEQSELAHFIDERYLVEFLSRVISEIEDIMSIDPNLDQRKILEIAAERIAYYLNAKASSIRLFDPQTLNMTTFGAHNIAEEDRLLSVPLADSISGKVVRENHSISVPSIPNDPFYKTKDLAKRKGFYSLLAVPLRIPRFMDPGTDLLGSIQIYYGEDNREFNKLEIILAEVLARRISYVLVKKKILDLQKLNTRKERIVNKIFVQLSKREGIKLKDLFYLLIPELGESLQIQSCALFSVSKDQKYVSVEAAYPVEKSYHEIGHAFTVERHPYFHTLIHNRPYEDNPFERIDPTYLLIKDPQASALTSPGMREFVERNQIHSILLVPLKANEIILYIMMFYAIDQRQYFTEDEIELMTFFGREIMKASRMELLGDILHDLKNPAVAVAGFANRARNLLMTGDLEKARDKLISYLDIIMRETIRLQDLTFAMALEEREEVLDLSQVALKRFDINREALLRLGRFNIEVHEPDLEPNLLVYCPLFGLERVLDNIFNNATKAVPEEGGLLGMRTHDENGMACLEVWNTGEIPGSQIEQIRRGDVKGRGLNIIYRFVQANHGRISIHTESGLTILTIKLPRHYPEYHG
ncbi:MAG: GAF domain-containing protein [Pseudomonadota bacterium]